MEFSPLTGRIGGQGAAVWGIHFEALRQRAAGREVIVLSVGEPDQAPPARLVAATQAALAARAVGYSPILGERDLRRAIAARMERRSGAGCGAENVAVLPGAQGGLYAVLQCLAGPEDEVIVPEPMYATYEAVVGASGARLVSVPLRPERGFHLDPAELAAAVTGRTRVVWINTPHNPTGAVMTRAEMEAVGGICRRHHLWLVSDEVYEELAFAREHVSAWSLAGAGERRVVVSSLSKSHAAPGFRLGWAVAPEPLVGHLFNLLLCMQYGGPPFVQAGAAAALAEDLPEVAALAADYRRRAARMVQSLAAAPGCRAHPPEGGMFLMLDVRASGLGAEAFARALLEREAVSVLPCDGLGANGAGHLRIGLAAPDDLLAEAARRMVRFAAGLAGR